MSDTYSPSLPTGSEGEYVDRAYGLVDQEWVVRTK